MSYAGFKHLNTKAAFYSIYTALSLLIIFFLAASLQSGATGTYLFIRNDVITDSSRLAFHLGFLVAFITSTIICLRLIRIPRYDFFNRILTINIVVYGILGLTLSVSRIQLFSRPVFLSEFLITTILLVVFHFIRHRAYPTRLVGFPGVDIAVFNVYPNLEVSPLTRKLTDVKTKDGIIVDLGKQLDSELSLLLANLVQARFPIYDSKELLETLWGRVALGEFAASEVEAISPPVIYPVLKRIIELLFILALSPIIILVLAIAIVVVKVGSPGPIFFTQMRIGRHGAPFRIFKLRTMYYSTLKSSIRATTSKDPRVTYLGRLMRRLRIDELPQIWHVITGDMSLIGPRPEQSDLSAEFERIIPYYGLRHAIRPGISGWAQVMHGYADTIEQTRLKIEFDLFYIKNMSLWLDLVIVSKTLRTIIFGTGSR